MIRYLARRLVYGFFILLGVNLITFVLFFAVNTPDDMARLAIGGRYVSAEAIAGWKSAHGYDKPLFWNDAEQGLARATRTIFWERSVPLLRFDFGSSDRGRSINREIAERAGPSLALALPTFLLSVGATTSLALLLVLFRRTRAERRGLVACVFLMSVSSLFYIIFGQWLFARVLRLVPISGFGSGWHLAVFLILPVAIGVLSRLGSDTLFYRTMFLEEIGRDYVRTARAKGLSEMRVLFTHVLRNAMLPIITSTVAAIPLLFMGSLVMESFFGIPGLGSYTIDAINEQDFSIVRAMVFLGTALYIAGLILTDIAYTLADPRVRLE
ncbi:MAG: ABC transporter permease [Mesosutterella sp.]|nr:ABC transporter permease [Mesosutterella sp.]